MWIGVEFEFGNIIFSSKDNKSLTNEPTDKQLLFVELLRNKKKLLYICMI